NSELKILSLHSQISPGLHIFISSSTVGDFHSVI
ncbi:hypothetical protein ZOSMA_9637G00010, partial [Zostera marina]